MATKATVKAPGTSGSTWKGYAKGIAQARTVVASPTVGAGLGAVSVPKQPVAAAQPAAQPSAAPGTSVTPTPIANGTPLDLAGLTGDQQQAYIDAYSKYQSSMTGLGQQASTAATTQDQNTAAENKAHVANTASENYNDAARGMFTSSIRDGDLNDLDATHVQNLNNIGAAYNAAINGINAQISGLNTNWGAEQGLMDWYRISNSQANTPPVATPAAGPSAPANVPVTASTPAWKGYAAGQAQTQKATGVTKKSGAGLIGVAKARM